MFSARFLLRFLGAERRFPFCLLPFRGIIRLDGFCLDDDVCVTPLVVLALVGDCPGNVTTRQSERCSECRECCDEHRDDDFDNLLLTHNQPPIKSPFAS